jgi:starvation-inducible DNA-binding protein
MSMTTEKSQNTNVVEILQARLSDALDLSGQLRQAHWNVKSPQFIQLHELFETINGTMSEHIDLLGERIVALASVADGQVQTTVNSTNLPAYPIDARSSRDHLSAISQSLTLFAKTVRSDIDQTAEMGDPGTSDLFTEISREADKNLWIVNAHLEG